MKSRSHAIVAAAIGTVLLLATITTVSTATLENAFAYQKNQATSQTNACGNGEIPTNVGCQNTDSQIQGDENAVALIAQQTFPEVVEEEPPPPEPQTATLNVIKEVNCPAGSVCPAPSDFTINIAGNNPNPSSFPGSAMGTEVLLEPGMYEVTEMVPETPPDFTVFSPDCSGDIQAGQELTCTIINEFIIP